jgi:AcrR family transcriptional regulator
MASTDRAEERRAKLLAVAAEVFSRRGYRATSMRDLAALAGIGKPTLYHYFASKEQLLTRLYQQVMDECLASARAIVAEGLEPRATLRALIVDRVVHTCENQDLLRIFFEEEAELPPDLARSIVALRRQYEDIFIEAVEASRADGAGAGADTIDSRLYVYTALGAANWVYKWYRPSGPHTPAELGAEIADVLLASIDP